MRINAFLASCGIASRRKAEALTRAGRVRVNGEIVLTPSFQVNDGDEVQLDGRLLSPCRRVYAVMNKPRGVVCAVTDPYDPVVVGLLPERIRSLRAYPVGRLDRESEGLLVLTNDGDFAQSILHPSRGVHKEYEALLNAGITSPRLERWRRGFEIEGHKVVPLALSVLEREPRGRWVRVVIGEGLKREVRVMARLAGFSVQRLIRRRIGRMVLTKLPAGEFLDLSFSELYTKIFEGGEV